MPSTWQSKSINGVYIRLSWSEVNPAPGVFDFSTLDREMNQAVAHGKRFAFSFQAGKRGTPAWIFDHGVQPLRLRDAGSSRPNSCGAWMLLGSPIDERYQAHYFALLSAAAKHIRSRSDWFRALAYVKPSGANLYTHENRLPKRCNTDAGCVCNTEILAKAGYTPKGLFRFYRKQLDLLAAAFPSKPLVYALIQEGFPKINDRGGYLLGDGSSSDGHALPGPFAQTQAILDLGQSLLGRRFVVQHNGLRPAPTAGTCPNQDMHPVPMKRHRWYGRPGSGCPNRWVLREGAQGQLTAFQTVNARNGVDDPTSLEAALQNVWSNSDANFLEIYEERLWEAERHDNGVLDKSASGRTLAEWKHQLELRQSPPTR